MKTNPITPIKKCDVEKLNTKALLARLSQLRKLTDRPELSDLTEQELHKTASAISFKNTPAWKQAWADVKQALSTRDHVQRGSKQRRQQDAFDKKHR